MEGQEKGLREIAQGMEKTLGRMEVTLDRISLSLLASQRSEKEKFWEARMSQGDVLIRECLRMGMDAKKIMKDIHNTLIPMYCALLQARDAREAGRKPAASMGPGGAGQGD